MNRVLVAVCLLLAGCLPAGTGLAANARPPSPSGSWRLAFVRDGDIWVANGDGSGQKLLVKDAEAPAWSADRKQIAFARGGNVWVAKADGSQQRQLTFRREGGEIRGDHFGESMESRPVDLSWDPRAPFITFSHWEEFELRRGDTEERKTIACCSVYDVPLDARADRSELIPRFDAADEEAAYCFSYHGHPTWSPSGGMLAFVRNGDIWVADRHLDEQGRPTFPLGPDYDSDIWEVTVSRLAAVAAFDAPTDRLSRENYGVAALSWSPDAKLLAYEIRRLGGSGFDEIRVLTVGRDEWGRPAAERERTLVKDGSAPCFSLDGRFVAYTHEDGIHAISVDGRTDRLLIKDGEQAAW